MDVHVVAAELFGRFPETFQLVIGPAEHPCRRYAGQPFGRTVPEHVAETVCGVFGRDHGRKLVEDFLKQRVEPGHLPFVLLLPGHVDSHAEQPALAVRTGQQKPDASDETALARMRLVQLLEQIDRLVAAGGAEVVFAEAGGDRSIAQQLEIAFPDGLLRTEAVQPAEVGVDHQIAEIVVGVFQEELAGQVVHDAPEQNIGVFERIAAVQEFGHVEADAEENPAVRTVAGQRQLGRVDDSYAAFAVAHLLVAFETLAGLAHTQVVSFVFAGEFGRKQIRVAHACKVFFRHAEQPAEAAVAEDITVAVRDVLEPERAGQVVDDRLHEVVGFAELGLPGAFLRDVADDSEDFRLASVLSRDVSELHFEHGPATAFSGPVDDGLLFRCAGEHFPPGVPESVPVFPADPDVDRIRPPVRIFAPESRIFDLPDRGLVRRIAEIVHPHGPGGSFEPFVLAVHPVPLLILLRDVAEDQHGAGDGSVRIPDRGGAVGDVPPGTVLPDEVGVIGHLHRTSFAQRPAERGRHRSVVDVAAEPEAFVEAVPDQLLRLVTGQFRGDLVHEGDDFVFIGHDHAVADRLQRQFEPFGERFGGAAQGVEFGDVGRHPQHGFAIENTVRQLDEFSPAALPRRIVFECDGPAGVHDRVDRIAE